MHIISIHQIHSIKYNTSHFFIICILYILLQKAFAIRNVLNASSSLTPLPLNGALYVNYISAILRCTDISIRHICIIRSLETIANIISHPWFISSWNWSPEDGWLLFVFQTFANDLSCLNLPGLQRGWRRNDFILRLRKSFKFKKSI